jgi:hypothetical protein
MNDWGKTEMHVSPKPGGPLGTIGARDTGSQTGSNPHNRIIIALQRVLQSQP